MRRGAYGMVRRGEEKCIWNGEEGYGEVHMEWRGGVRRGAYGMARRGEERCIWNGEEG